MRRLDILMGSVAALVVFGAERDALAGSYSCGSASSAYSQECFFGNSFAPTTSEFICDGGIAVLGGDTSSGQGVVGTSNTAMGVYGITGLGSPSDTISIPSLKAGVYGTNGGSAHTPTATGTYGVFGFGSGSIDGVHGETSSTSNGSAAVAGVATSSGVGVSGSSSNYYGVLGSGTDGVHGTSSGSGSGVAGVNSGTGNGVYGHTSSTTAGGAGGSFSNASSGYGVYASSSSGNAIYATSSGSGASAYAGYFTTSGTYSAGFNKDIWVNGGSVGPSDERLKKNITPLAGPHALDKLLKLKGVTFEWKEPEQHSDQRGPQIGFIAQDVEKVFPNWVHTGQDGYKGLSVAQIEGLEVESIRELKAENDALKARLDALESGRRPVVSWNPNIGIGAMGLAICGVLFVTRRRRDADKS